MKQMYFTALLALPLSAFSQISIDVSDMPQVGDVVSRKADTMTVLAGPGNAGANQTWDFTQTSSYIIDENTSIVAPSSTPYASSFPSANLAMTNDNASYLFFDQNASSQTAVGLAGDVLGTGTPINAPMIGGDLIHNFPRTYGSNFSDSYTVDVTVDASSINAALNQIRFKRVVNAKDSTDAWGQLTTPVGTYNSLRAKRTEYSTDSIWVKPVFPPTWTLYQNTKDTTETYQWYAKGGKLAIAEMTFDSLGAPKKYTWSLEAPIWGLDELTANTVFDVYPNPVQNEVNIAFHANEIGEKATFTLMDQSGRIIRNEEWALTSNKQTVNCSDLTNGVYFIQVKTGKSQALSRFVKQ